MQTLLKQSIIGGLSFLLLTGIAFSVGSSEPSQFNANAAAVSVISKFGSTAGRLTSGWSQTGAYVLGSDYAGLRTPNSTYSSASYLEGNISAITTAGFDSNITVDSKIGSFGGSETSGNLKAAFFDSTDGILGSPSEGAFSLSAVAESYAQSSNYD